VNSEDVGMLEAGSVADLPLEALGPERRSELRVQDLERDRTVVLEVVSEVDGRHAAAPELPLESVAVTQSVGEDGSRVRHEVVWGHRNLGVVGLGRQRAPVFGRYLASTIGEP
jgi:hypothetical protein